MTKGRCRYCGEVIMAPNGKPSTRALWHKDCVAEYKLIYHPAETRKAVARRDRGKCYICGTVTARWELEHIKPLYEAKGDLSYWKLDNVSCCCIPCHRQKSAAEAGRRAAARKLEKK